MAERAVTNKIVPLANKLQPESFLELGTLRGDNFRAIRCPRKVSVDINDHGTFKGTTDKFFAQNKARFDVVFIDACHDIEFALRDWNNAIKVADRLIVLHDMVPPTAAFLQRNKCSNAYLLLNALIDADVEHRTLDQDCGLTVVLAEHFREFTSPLQLISYQEFMPKVQVCPFQRLVAYAGKGFL